MTPALPPSDFIERYRLATSGGDLVALWPILTAPRPSPGAHVRAFLLMLVHTLFTRKHHVRVVRGLARTGGGHRLCCSLGVCPFNPYAEPPTP